MAMDLNVRAAPVWGDSDAYHHGGKNMPMEYHMTMAFGKTVTDC